MKDNISKVFTRNFRNERINIVDIKNLVNKNKRENKDDVFITNKF